jgi:hypothetical protein
MVTLAEAMAASLAAGTTKSATLVPGEYTVEAKAQGFRSARESGIVIQIGWRKNLRGDMAGNRDRPRCRHQTLGIIGRRRPCRKIAGRCRPYLRA